MTEDRDPLLGRELEGRYRLEARLGEGGLGVVYRAKHLRLGRTFAIKVLQPAYAENEALRGRFEREAKALGALSHPGVVGVTDFGIDGKVPFLVMELLTGATLDQRMPLPPDRALQVLRDILSAVAYAHGLGLVHRDLKPANIFLERLPEGAERVRVLDFGLAKFLEGPRDGSVLTRPGATLGTPAYMPPEQALGSATSPRSDVYSLGILLYELLALQRPFTGEGGELMRQHLLMPIPSLKGRAGLAGLPVEGLDAIVQKAAAKTAADRFADASEMRSALDAVLGRVSGPFPTSRPTPADASRTALEAQPTLAAPVAAEPAVTVVSGPRKGPSSEPDATRKDGSAPQAAPPSASTVTPAPRMPQARSAQGTVAAPRPPARGGALLFVALLATVGAVLFVPRLLGLGFDPLAEIEARVSGLETTSLPPLPEVPALPALPELPSTGILDPVLSVEPATPRVEGPGAGPLDAGVDAPTRMARFDHDPWLDPVPREVARLRERVENGDPLSDRAVDTLRNIGRSSPGDPRPWLLIGHHMVNRGALSDALERYGRAVSVNDGARYDARMQENLVVMAANRTVHDRAQDLLLSWYGHDALETLRRVRVRRDDSEEIERLDAFEEVLAAAPPRLAVPLPAGP